LAGIQNAVGVQGVGDRALQAVIPKTMETPGLTVAVAGGACEVYWTWLSATAVRDKWT